MSSFALLFCSCALSIPLHFVRVKSFLGFFLTKCKVCMIARTFNGKERIICAKLIE
nr:MAG TPA: hypothetical protein [Caudoviricetes sp.]